MKRQMRMILAAGAVLGAGAAFAASDVTVPAPNGVGDVVALTNALTQANAGTFGNVLLEPGVYDLKDVAMESGTHLVLAYSHKLIGKGTSPDKVVLLGGGESKSCRVLKATHNNWNYATVSNLTVTGGYAASGEGGGIHGEIAYVYDCIISNNFAYGGNRQGGGGFRGGYAVNCLFADNKAGGDDRSVGGGMWSNGYRSRISAHEAGAVNCVFRNNEALGSGGGYYGVAWYKDQYSGGQAPAIGCTFEDNTTDGTGGGAYMQSLVSNCVFRLNKSKSGGNALAGAGESECCEAIGCELSANTNGGVSACNYVTFRHSVITNHVSSQWVIQYCNLYGCLVADNCGNYSASGGVFDRGGGSFTNANSIFLRNYQAGNNKITGAKVVINCLYAENEVGNANYGNIVDAGGIVYNTVFVGNKMGSAICDFRKALKSSPYVPKMYNCTYSKLADDVTTDETDSRWTNCVKKTLAELKYSTKDSARPYVPSRRSPLRNKALDDPWILATLGEKDFYGEVRVFEDALDIGPAECVEPALGMILLFR